MQNDLDTISKIADDLRWQERVGDIAELRKVQLTGPPNAINPNPTSLYAKNPVIIPAYVLLPKKRAGKLPLIVFLHFGMHWNFDTEHHGLVARELLEQGYAIIAPEYRGSTGYGAWHRSMLDYGGLEVEDAFAARNWAVENLPVDADRVGTIGWSHGGLIALMNAILHPGSYQAVYAGNPVTDLVMRMGYTDPGYQAQFSAADHIGKSAADNLAEYKRRSPVFNIQNLKAPLLVHGNTNDEDVNVIEVEHLVQALKAAGKKFEYKIYEDAPGGHHFNLIDTKVAKESRREVYKFLAKYLSPPNPAK